MNPLAHGDMGIEHAGEADEDAARTTRRSGIFVCADFMSTDFNQPKEAVMGWRH